MIERSVLTAILRGARGHCPNCGIGPMFTGFLTVRDACPDCGEALHHHRADDAPPYVVMFIVGHVVVGLMLFYEIVYTPPMWQHALIFLPLTIVMSLVLLQPVKGALVGLQWANRMHGFGTEGGSGA